MASYVLNKQDFILEDFDGDFILLNAKSGVYFEVAERAADLLRTILAGICPVRTISALDAVKPDAATELRSVFDKLVQASVIHRAEIETDAAAVEPKPEHLAALAAGGAYIFEGFDDMSALILADPVHDIDLETGRLLWAKHAD